MRNGQLRKAWKSSTETVQSASLCWALRLQKVGRSFLFEGKDMKDLGLIKAAAALPLLILGATSADSQSIAGALGPQSRAAIRIEASVMPTLKVSSATSTPSLSLNAPSIRYSLLIDNGPASSPVGTSGSPARSPDGPLVMLVVPD